MAMIDLSKLQFGDVIYHIEHINSILTRHKIKMIDANGVEWYRYDRPTWLYKIHELMYVGSVVKICRGKITNPEDQQDEYHFEYKSSGNVEYYFENDPYFDDCYPSLEAAQQRVKELEEQDHDY